MRVLVACEFSGVVRDAFTRAGHEAWSCDLLESERPSQYHVRGDVRDILDDPGFTPWDMLLAFPPCTHLAVSGARYFARKQKEQQEALAFVRQLLNSGIQRIALENPIGVISSQVRKPEQIIQPWQFGHPESKSTCLWLENLPQLKPTNVLECERIVNGRPRWNNQTPSGQNRLGPSPERARNRGRTYEGIAQAMASQWGNLS